MQSFSSLVQIRKLLSDQQVTLPSVVEHYLGNIDKNQDLNAIIEVFREEALDSSKQIQKKNWSGESRQTGRTNCDEFAMGASNETSVHGPVLNPVNRTKVAGGSAG